MKTISLLRAVLSQDMNMFKYSTKKKSSKLKKILFPVFLFVIVCLSIGTYAYMMGENLYSYNLTYIMLTMFIFMVTIMTFIEGIYKSQGILFETKDNDMLFSLPIKRYQILFVRIFKLLLFQFVFNLMFLLPAFIVFIYFEKPGFNFYFISIVMAVLIPIIPTIISSFLGYIVKMISSRFKSKKIIQVLLSTLIFLGIFYISMNLDDFVQDIVLKATSINEILIKIYYPLGLYINLIDHFNILEFIKLLLINILPLIVFILIGEKYYFQIISNSKETSMNNKKELKKEIIRKRNPLISLVYKELSRYFSSIVYMFNTSFGLILIVLVTVLLCFKGQHTFDTILTNYGISTELSLSILFYFLILFAGSMSSITSSSISLEGKTINVTKSLPIKEESILLSKIITCYVIELPFMLISDILFIIKFKPSVGYVLLLILLTFIVILLTSCIGLIVNLKYPKMDATNDTEVVKQSMSSMISVFIGMFIFVGSILLVWYFNKYISINLLITIHLALMFILSIILYFLLMKNGPKEYRNINV